MKALFLWLLLIGSMLPALAQDTTILTAKDSARIAIRIRKNIRHFKGQRTFSHRDSAMMYTMYRNRKAGKFSLHPAERKICRLPASKKDRFQLQ